MLDGPHITVQRFREGTVHTIGGAVYFEPFQAELREGEKVKLDLVTKALAGKRNKIEIRGHTARVPLPSDAAFAGKWELGFARATAIDLAGRDVFEAVQVSVNPKVITTPPISAIAKIVLARSCALNFGRLHTKAKTVLQIMSPQRFRVDRGD